MLVAGIALGALLGPGPAASLASGTRAAVVARVLALMALDGAGQSGQPLAAAVAEHHQVSDNRPSAQPAGSTGAGGSSRALSASTGGGHSAQSETGSSTGSSTPSAESTPSPTGRRSPAANSHPPARLPAIGHAWLIVLPYGQSFSKVLAEPAEFPFLSAELRQGTLLSGYSALGAQQLAGAATLLSGAVESAVNTIEPPGESTGAEADDAYVQTVVGEITASAAYGEGGLIAIAFAGAPASPAAASAQPTPGQTPTPPTATPPPAGQPTAAQPTAATQPAPSQTGAPGQAQAIPYPAGTQASTLSATTTGALLLSPYLRRPGARLTSAFDAATPRASIEELLRDSKSVGR